MRQTVEADIRSSAAIYARRRNFRPTDFESIRQAVEAGRSPEEIKYLLDVSDDDLCNFYRRQRERQS